MREKKTFEYLGGAGVLEIEGQIVKKAGDRITVEIFQETDATGKKKTGKRFSHRLFKEVGADKSTKTQAPKAPEVENASKK